MRARSGMRRATPDARERAAAAGVSAFFGKGAWASTYVGARAAGGTRPKPLNVAIGGDLSDFSYRKQKQKVQRNRVR